MTALEAAAPRPRPSRGDQRNTSSHLRWVVALGIVTIAVALPVFVRLSDRSDIAAHAKIAMRLMEEGQWFTYSLWYPLLYLTGGASGADADSLRAASVALLVLAVLVTSLLTYRFAWLVTRSAPKAFAVAGLLLLVMPLIDPWRPRSIYMGQVSPTIWHNSTNVFVLPFAIVAFTSALSLLRDPTRVRATAFGLISTVMILAKPNFAMALLPVVGVLLVVAMRRRGTRLPDIAVCAALAFALPAVVLVGQYLVIFWGTSTGLGRGQMAFAPFAAWSKFSPNIAWSLVLSIAGPAVATIALRRRTPWSDARWLAWLVFAVALAQMALLAERSSLGIVSSGNWFWGAYTAVFVVFMVTMAEVARERHTGWRRLVAMVASVLFVAHAVSGVVYAVRAGVDGFPITIDYQELESG